MDHTYRAAIEARLRADLSAEHWSLVQQLVWLEGEETDQTVYDERERLLEGLQRRFPGIPIWDAALEIVEGWL